MKTLSKPGMLTSTLLLGAVLVLGSHTGTAQVTEPEKSAQITIPATADGIWIVIDKEVQALTGVIQAGKLNEVDHHAFAIRDLVRALPERSKGFTAGHVQKIEENVHRDV